MSINPTVIQYHVTLPRTQLKNNKTNILHSDPKFGKISKRSFTVLCTERKHRNNKLVESGQFYKIEQ